MDRVSMYSRVRACEDFRHVGGGPRERAEAQTRLRGCLHRLDDAPPDQEHPSSKVDSRVERRALIAPRITAGIKRRGGYRPLEPVAHNWPAPA